MLSPLNPDSTARQTCRVLVTVIVSIVAATTCSLHAPAVSAQGPVAPRFKYEGTLLTRSGGQYVVKLAGGGHALVHANPNRPPQMPALVERVKGKATVKELRQGMYVELKGIVKDRKIAEPVRALTVIGYELGATLGAFPDAGDGKFDVEEKLPEGAERMKVSGRLQKLTSVHAFTISYRGGSISGVLADDAEVTFDSSDLQYAKLGAPIVVEGFHDPILNADFATQVSIYIGPKPIEAASEPFKPVVPAAGAAAGPLGGADADAKGVKFKGAILRVN
ncbi:hypothetical protein [Lignipirellula cremea]|nr:hypothetical protein [Lignipirellula cremea]